MDGIRISQIRVALTFCALLLLIAVTGCGALVPTPQEKFPFSVPLEIYGNPVGTQIIDTGGGYEVLLKEPYGLKVIDQTNVLAFAGHEDVDVTEPFEYSVGGFVTFAPGALVGVSTCDCNALGFHFFQRTGIRLALDFSTRTADFVLSVPDGGRVVWFSRPPDDLADFLSSFIDVDVTAGGKTRTVRALLDTGATVSVMRRGLLGGPPVLGSLQQVTLARPELGGVQASVGLFDTDGLPDLIIGTDVMGVWADQWYLDFSTEGGYATVFVTGDRPDLTPETTNLELH